MSSRILQLRAPLLWLLFPFATGLVAAQRWPLPAFGPWPLLALASGAAFLALRSAHRPGWWMTTLALSAGLAGYVMLHVRYPHLHEWSRRPPREVTVVLEVRRPFPPAPTARNLAGLATITRSGENDPALRDREVYYSAIRRLSANPQRSGCYLVQGVLEPLPPDTGGTGFNAYLASAGVRHRLTRTRILGEVRAPGRLQTWCARIEDRLEAILCRGLETHPVQRSLYVAMLLGEKAVMNPDQQNAFMQSGTFHIFSISGLHVAVIAGALRILLGLLRVPKRAGVVVTIGLLWLYVQITGNSSPALRAFLMIAFVLASQLFVLPANSLAALAGSALVTLLLDPLQLFSTGFQMSYAVVAALILMGRPLAEHWLARWRPFQFLPKPAWRWRHHVVHACGRWLISTLALGWSAFLASVPSGIGFFGLLSPGSLLANLVVIPLSGGVIHLGFFALLAGLPGLGPASVALNLLAARLIGLIEILLQAGVRLPGMYFTAQFRSDTLAPLGLLLITGAMLAGASTRWSPKGGGYWPPFVLLLGLLILGVKFG
jgi:competence protein ComEC